MPTYFEGHDFASLTKMRRAWTAHYMAKGCHRMKAERCARRKFNTWPTPPAETETK